MENREILSGSLRFLRNVLLIDAGLLVIVGLICWFGGWRTVYRYGGGLFWAGLAAMMVGTSSARSTWDTNRSFDHQYVMSVSKQSIHNRLRQQLADVAKGNRFFYLMFAAAVVLMVMGAVIQTGFR